MGPPGRVMPMGMSPHGPVHMGGHIGGLNGPGPPHFGGTQRPPAHLHTPRHNHHLPPTPHLPPHHGTFFQKTRNSYNYKVDLR